MPESRRFQGYGRIRAPPIVGTALGTLVSSEFRVAPAIPSRAHTRRGSAGARAQRLPPRTRPPRFACSPSRAFPRARAPRRRGPPQGSPRDEDSCPRVAPRGAEAAPAGARARREARAAACRDDEEEDQGRGVPDEGGRPSQVRPRRAFRPRRAAIFSNSPSRLSERSPAASARNLTPRVPAGFFFFFFRRDSTRRATG